MSFADDPRLDDQQLEPIQPDAQSAQSNQSQWHGRTARDAQGRRIMWQEPQNGRGGRFVQLSEATATQQARESLQNERARLGTLSRTAPLAEEYININRTTPTGSWGARSLERERRAQAEPDGNLWHGLNMPTQMEPHRAELERMETLQDQALRGNIPQGGAQTANSAFEQQVLRGLFPTISQLGPVNMQNAATLMAERDLQRLRLQAMEHWLTEHQDLGDFEASWASTGDRLRPQLVQRYTQHLSSPQLGAGNGQAPQRPASVPADYLWDGRHWVRPD